MLFALSTDHEIGLGSAGATFIVFALLSSFVFPRIWPGFPGRNGLRWYLPLCVCFFLGMMAAVIVFGRAEPTAAAAAPTTPSSSSSSGSSTSGMLTSGPYANGSATAGKSEFTADGCAACHTFKAAGASGTIGPDLDKIATYATAGKVALEQFIAESITAPPPPYVPAPFPKNVMPKDGGHTLSNAQVADLVAFIAKDAAG